VVSLPESLYFRPGSANLKPESLEALAKVAAALASQRGQILVEGHTDDLPVVSTLFTSNWELSAARAARVVRYLVEEAGFDGARLAAIGLSDTKPLTENVDDASREVNRRVQIIVVTETNTEE
jgi:chemotaxis protein MotB